MAEGKKEKAEKMAPSPLIAVKRTYMNKLFLRRVELTANSGKREKRGRRPSEGKGKEKGGGKKDST